MGDIKDHAISNIETYDVMKEAAVRYMPSMTVSGILQVTGVWLSDVYFFRRIGTITSNINDFLDKPDERNRELMYLAGIYTSSEIMYLINNYIIANTIPKLELEIIEDMVNKTFTSVSTTKTGNKGENINVNEYIMNIRKLTELRVIYNFIVSGITPAIVVMCGMLWEFKSCGKVGIYVIMALTILILVSYYMEVNDIELFQNSDKQYNLFFDALHDIINNIDTVMSNGTYNFEKNNINREKTIINIAKTSNDESIVRTYFYLKMLCFAFLGFITHMGIDCYDNKSMGSANVLSIYLITISFIDRYDSFLSRFRLVADKLGKLNEVDDYFKTFNILDTNANDELIVNNGNIEIKNLLIKYGTKTVVNDMSFVIPGGKITGVIGDIGSGKSTMIKAIIGTVPYTGTILVDGMDISKCTTESVTRHITYVPQHPKLFNNTIGYNILYGTHKTNEYLNDMLKDSDLLDFFKVFNSGLDTQVGKEGSKLSGGQKQMVALIRALIHSKKIVLMDEPSSSLDPETKELIMRLINIMNKRNKSTIVIITHDDGMSKLFNQVINFSKPKKQS